MKTGMRSRVYAAVSIEEGVAELAVAELVVAVVTIALSQYVLWFRPVASLQSVPPFCVR